MNFIVPYVIYPFEVMFSFGQTDKEVYADLKKWGVGKRSASYKYDGSYAATFPYDEGGSCLVRIKQIPQTAEDFSYLQHEIFHAIFYLTQYVGIALSKSSEESFTYLIQYLTKQVYTKIFDQHKPVNHEKETV